MDQGTREPEIRDALHRKLLKKQHSCKKTIVINELGLNHGRQRIDIAVLNGKLHGYEIKSSQDSLNRLEKQLAAYELYFERLTLIVAENHLEGVVKMAPRWCEIIVLRKGARGAIYFRQYRRAQRNSKVDINSLLHLLWKKEALEFISELNIDGEYSRRSRVKLYELIAQVAGIEEVIDWTKKCFESRVNWRAVQ
ncbi:MAG: sce7726 family protein [Pseudohongiellaceae bacterium]